MKIALLVLACFISLSFAYDENSKITNEHPCDDKGSNTIEYGLLKFTVIVFVIKLFLKG